MSDLDPQGSSRLLKEVCCSKSSFKLNENGRKYHKSFEFIPVEMIPNKNPGKDVHNPNNAEGVISKLQLSKFRHQ